MMKKLFVMIGLLVFIGVSSPSCSRKSGCPAEEAVGKVGKKGNLSTKRGKSNLFSKDVRKKNKQIN